MKLTEADIREGLARLEPNQPWAHDITLPHGVHTVSEDNEQFRRKAEGLRKIGDIIIQMARYHTRRGSVEGLTVCDLASGEGGHSLMLAQAGAERVLGLEGRDLYVRRARFAAEALGLSNVEFRPADLRTLDTGALGTFDLVVCSGILHHLGAESFEDFLATLRALTGDTAVIYTHISTELAVKSHRLTGPVSTRDGYDGYAFREHRDDATAEQRSAQVRASLDNTFSFWASERSLMSALGKAGFKSVSRLMLPHIFGWEGASYRPILFCRV
jgi:tRNA (mo5U34)-methyltransferase